MSIPEIARRTRDRASLRQPERQKEEKRDLHGEARECWCEREWRRQRKGQRLGRTQKWSAGQIK